MGYQILAGTPNVSLDYPGLVSLEIASEAAVKRAGGTIGWGLAGAAVLGPVGLLAGLIAGGKGSDVTFIASFDDGSSILCKADRKSFEKIHAKAFDAIRRHRAVPTVLLRDEVPDYEPKKLLPSSEMPSTLVEPFDQVVWIMEKAGWRISPQEKKPGTRLRVLLALNESGAKYAMACTSDILTPYAFGLLADAVRKFGPEAALMIVGRSITADTKVLSSQEGIAVAEPKDVLNVIGSSSKGQFDF